MVGVVTAVEELEVGTLGVVAAVEELEVVKTVGVVAAIKVVLTLVAVKEEETAKEVLATLRSSAIFLFSEGRYRTVCRILHVLVRTRARDFANCTRTGFANCLRALCALRTYVWTDRRTCVVAKLHTQAQAEPSNTAHANSCRASVVLQTHTSGPFSLLPILFNVNTTSEVPSLDNSTVLLTVKR